MIAGDVRKSAEKAYRAEVVLLRRLKVALFAAVVIPLCLLVAGSWDEHAQLLRVAEGHALTTVTALREHAFKAIETHEFLVRELDRRLQGMSWDTIRASSAVLSAEIEAMRAGMPEISAMSVADAEGWRQAGSGGHDRDGHVLVKQRDYWFAQRDADQGTFISRPYIGMISGRPDFAISRRRTSADGSFSGTIHVSVTSSYFTSFWAQVVAGQRDAIVTLVRLDGAVLARLPDPGEMLAPLVAQHSPLMEHVAADPRGGVFRAVTPSDGIDRIYAYSRVGDYPLVVVYRISLQSVFAPGWQDLLKFGGVGLLGTVALVLAVLAAMQQVRRLIAEQARGAAIEEAVQQAQRLALLGQFAAGVAHDFANILQGMGAVATLLKNGASQSERVCSLADRLDADVERGASLTRRMLDLVRHNSGKGETRNGDVGDTVKPAEVMSSVAEMLPRLLSRGYRLRYELQDDVPPLTRGDRYELELSIMNLVVNARDAMPDGGEIVIRVTSERIEGPADESIVDHRFVGLAWGRYLRVSVADSGVGMPPEVLAQAGVLFFTTKPRGKGTGLGLASARSFAERAGGRLVIESAEGRGTTVTIWLPAVAPFPAPESRPVERAA